MSGKKFISPGAWFSLIYPVDWNEFEGEEGTFLFYDPVNWNGNFRISAYKKEFKQPGAMCFGKDFMQDEWKRNPKASCIRIGAWECVYSREPFQEDGKAYLSHIWITGMENMAFECTFAVPDGGGTGEAEKIIETLQIRKDGVKYPAEIIPIRLSEIADIDESYEWTVSQVKKQLKKDFRGIEEDVQYLQQIIVSDLFPLKKRDAWLSIGITLCVILANEIEGMEWMTLIDGNREVPVLQYRKTMKIIDPMRLVWSKIKAGEPCDVVEEYKNILESL